LRFFVAVRKWDILAKSCFGNEVPINTMLVLFLSFLGARTTLMIFTAFDTGIRDMSRL
jgi:hypothetical protein